MDARDRYNGQRDERTNGRTDGRTKRRVASLRQSVRLLDGVWHIATATAANRFRCSYVVIAPDRIDDGDVSFHGHQENAVSWRHQKHPERDSRKPYATNELVVAAVAWHASSVHLDDAGQQREERRAHVNDALVDDQNVHRLNTKMHDNQTQLAINLSNNYIRLLRTYDRPHNLQQEKFMRIRFWTMNE